MEKIDNFYDIVDMEAINIADINKEDLIFAAEFVRKILLKYGHDHSKLMNHATCLRLAYFLSDIFTRYSREEACKRFNQYGGNQ